MGSQPAGCHREAVKTELARTMGVTLLCALAGLAALLVSI
jgi:hypothetical protein